MKFTDSHTPFIDLLGLFLTHIGPYALVNEFRSPVSQPMTN